MWFFMVAFALAGFFTGIKLSLTAEILIAVVAFLLAVIFSYNKELEGIFYFVMLFVFIVGMALGDCYVVARYPSARESFFGNISQTTEWLFTPSNMITNKPEKAEKGN